MNNPATVAAAASVGRGDEIRAVRPYHYADQVVFVDGQPGCGKTMLAPIVAALDRVELLTFAYEIEHVCTLRFLGRMSADAAQTLIRLTTDLRLYNTMMGRETNLRPGDQSSVFSDIRPWRYLRRLFQPGDAAVPERIRRERPILLLTTHNLTAFSEPVFSALDGRAVFLELVRHPLYMIKQQALNMERLISASRHFTVYFDHKGAAVPYFTRGWEDLFLASNPMDRAIYSCVFMTEWTDAARERLRASGAARILTIPFERFVIDPWPYLRRIEILLDTRVTRWTRRMMARQKVPRRRLADGIDTRLYRRCGWEPPRPGATEEAELARRREYAARRASPAGLEALDALCRRYEERHLASSDRGYG